MLFLWTIQPIFPLHFLFVWKGGGSHFPLLRQKMGVKLEMLRRQWNRLPRRSTNMISFASLSWEMKEIVFAARPLKCWCALSLAVAFRACLVHALCVLCVSGYVLCMSCVSCYVLCLVYVLSYVCLVCVWLCLMYVLSCVCLVCVWLCLVYVLSCVRLVCVWLCLVYVWLCLVYVLSCVCIVYVFCMFCLVYVLCKSFLVYVLCKSSQRACLV